MRRRWPGFLFCLRTAPMMQLIRRLQDAIKAGFRGQIHALVRQSRHNLAGRQVGIVRLVADRQYLFPLLFRQLVRRLRALRLRALILANLASLLRPALEGAQAEAGFCTGPALPDTRCDGCADPDH